jgi:hypothetical protein
MVPVPSIHQLYADIDWADRSADEPANLARRRSWPSPPPSPPSEDDPPACCIPPILAVTWIEGGVALAGARGRVVWFNL